MRGRGTPVSAFSGRTALAKNFAEPARRNGALWVFNKPAGEWHYRRFEGQASWEQGPEEARKAMDSETTGWQNIDRRIYEQAHEYFALLVRRGMDPEAAVELVRLEATQIEEE